MSPKLTNTEIQVIDIVFPAVGLILTVTRLTLRVRSRLLWWDDALAFGSAIFTALMSAVTWIHYMDPALFSRTTRIAAYYGIAECFYVALWLARLSILYSILRIVHGSRTRRLLNGASVAFACVCAFLCAQVFWVCEKKPLWKEKPQPQCALGLQVAVCQLLTDVASDLLLIAVPIRLFNHTSLGRNLKIRLLVIFSAAALTTIVSLVHAAYILEGLGEQAIISAIVEISVSLMVCNFVVVVPAFWRSCGVHDAESGHERTFKLSTVRFAVTPAHAGVTRIGVDTTLTVQDSTVMDVTGIVHDRPLSSTADPAGRKNTRFDWDQEHVFETSAKGSQDGQEGAGDSRMAISAPDMHKKNQA